MYVTNLLKYQFTHHVNQASPGIEFDPVTADLEIANQHTNHSATVSQLDGFFREVWAVSHHLKP